MESLVIIVEEGGCGEVVLAGLRSRSKVVVLAGLRSGSKRGAIEARRLVRELLLLKWWFWAGKCLEEETG